jgi:glycosyltransferase involved in cell wall biosynthesis
MIEASVIICTYNPVIQILQRVLGALQGQTLEKERWELIIVDNNSSGTLAEKVHVNWHPHLTMVREEMPGLVYARLAGFRSCRQRALIFFVDDDNVLDSDYLKNGLLFHGQHPEVGCYGGRSFPEYETKPPVWFDKVGINLGCQDFGSELYLSDHRSSHFILKAYPSRAPIGTGMVLRHDAFNAYVKELNNSKMALGRKGSDLTSGEDNDMVLTIIKNGFEIAYVPSLTLIHVIPERRYSLTYLSEMAYKSNLSWNRLLSLHGINPRSTVPAWSVVLRQARAWIRFRAWLGQANYVNWRGACGVFRGLTHGSND